MNEQTEPIAEPSWSSLYIPEESQPAAEAEPVAAPESDPGSTEPAAKVEPVAEQTPAATEADSGAKPADPADDFEARLVATALAHKVPVEVLRAEYEKATQAQSELAAREEIIASLASIEQALIARTQKDPSDPQYMTREEAIAEYQAHYQAEKAERDRVGELAALRAENEKLKGTLAERETEQMLSRVASEFDAPVDVLRALHKGGYDENKLKEFGASYAGRVADAKTQGAAEHAARKASDKEGLHTPADSGLPNKAGENRSAGRTWGELWIK